MLAFEYKLTNMTLKCSVKSFLRGKFTFQSSFYWHPKHQIMFSYVSKYILLNTNSKSVIFCSSIVNMQYAFFNLKYLFVLYLWLTCFFFWLAGSWLNWRWLACLIFVLKSEKSRQKDTDSFFVFHHLGDKISCILKHN